MSGGLERRLNLLTVLVALQVLLLAVVLIFLLVPFRGNIAGVKPAARRGAQLAEQGKATAGQAAVPENTQPVVDLPETGELPPEVPLERAVRIEILNGCGVSGLAAKYANLLRTRGYDIRDTRNADRLDYPSSVIYDRSSLPGQAKRLAGLLGIPSHRVISRADPDLVDIDLTLVLGKDYSTLNLQP